MLRRATLTFATLLAIGVAACGSSSQNTILSTPAPATSVPVGCDSAGNQILRLSNADAGRSVVAGVGDKIEVTLQTIGPGEYKKPIVSSGSVVFTGEWLLHPFVPAGPTQLYSFEAVATGRAGITIPHTVDRPRGQIPAYSVTVKVQ